MARNGMAMRALYRKKCEPLLDQKPWTISLCSLHLPRCNLCCHASLSEKHSQGHIGCQHGSPKPWQDVGGECENQAPGTRCTHKCVYIPYTSLNIIYTVYKIYIYILGVCVCVYPRDGIDSSPRVIHHYQGATHVFLITSLSKGISDTTCYKSEEGPGTS